MKRFEPFAKKTKIKSCCKNSWSARGCVLLIELKLWTHWKKIHILINWTHCGYKIR